MAVRQHYPTPFRMQRWATASSAVPCDGLPATARRNLSGTKKMPTSKIKQAQVRSLRKRKRPSCRCRL